MKVSACKLLQFARIDNITALADVISYELSVDYCGSLKVGEDEGRASLLKLALRYGCRPERKDQLQAVNSLARESF